MSIAGSGHYPATKHAVEGYTKMAALEYAGEHEGEATFAMSLASAGEVTFQALT